MSDPIETMPTEVCWFCKQEFVKGADTPGVQVVLFMFRNHPSHTTHSQKINESWVSGATRYTRVGTVYWDEKSIHVPRCKSCSSKLVRKKTMGFIACLVLGLITEIVLARLAKFSLDFTFWFGATLIALFPAAMSLAFIYASTRDITYTYPVVKDHIDAGWETTNRHKEF